MEPPSSGPPATDLRLQARAEMANGTAWTLERSLNPAVSGGAGGGWFPMATGFGASFPQRHTAVAPPAEVPFLSPWFEGGPGGRQGFSARLLTVPLVPVPAPANAIGQTRLTQYRLAHVCLRRWAGNGTVVAQWKNSADPSGASIVAVLTPSQLDLSSPDHPERFPFGVGSVTGPATDPIPLFLSYSAYDLQQSPPTFSGTPVSSLNAENAAIRAFLLTHAAQIRSSLWPPESAFPPAPPSPATVDQRSFFRLRSTAAVSLTGYGVPSAIAAQANAPAASARRLRISEVCYSRTSLSGPLIGGEAADWVEIWNASATPLSTAGYFLSDRAGSSTKFALPVMTLAPGGYLVIHCTAEGRARMAAAPPPSDPMLPRTAGFDLQFGDTVFLNYQSSPGGPVLPVMQMPESGTVIPPATFPNGMPPDISYGVRQTVANPAPGSSPASSIAYGWFASPSQGQLNSDVLLTRSGTSPAPDSVVCPLPLIENNSSPVTAPVAQGGTLFSSGSFTVRLRGGSPADTLLYTLNGAEPTGQSAVYDPARPLTINGTTILNVKAFRTGLLPSGTVTRTFIHLPSVLTQLRPELVSTPLCDPVIAGAFSTAAAASAGEGSGQAYAPDPLVQYAAASAGGIAAQLSARPVMALTFRGGIIDPSLPETSGDSPVSVEFIDPGQPASYSQENAWLRRAGNHNSGGFSSAIKNSWHLLFKKNITLNGTDYWPGPVAGVTSGGVPGSALFPDPASPADDDVRYPATSFPRLVLRGGGSDAWGDAGVDGDGIGVDSRDNTCLKDAWLKESQRATGDWTARRRYVSVFLNGLYWGVYDLEEHPDADTLSTRLTFPPGLSQTQRDALAAKNILFLKYRDPSELGPGQSGDIPNDQTAADSWQAVISAAAAAYASPSSTAAWSALTGQLDLDSYISYITTLDLTGKGDHGTRQFAAWRHPADLKWRLIHWDGDGCGFMREENISNPLVPGTDSHDIRPLSPVSHLDPDIFTNISLDLKPHEYLKFHPAYRTAFDRRLRELLQPAPASTPSSPAPKGSGAFVQDAILQRFDGIAGQVRRTLEAELMRWTSTGNRENSGGSSLYPGSARDYWSYNLYEARFQRLDGTDWAPVLRTRQSVKNGARWAGLLNDIPPPVITFNPATRVATATRGGSDGRVYITSGSIFSDPINDYSSPVYNPPYGASIPREIASDHKFITARVYAPDFEYQLGWSAISVYPIP